MADVWLPQQSPAPTTTTPGTPPASAVVAQPAAAQSPVAGAPTPLPAVPLDPATQLALPVQTALRFPDVYLLTSGPQGPTAIPGLQLGLDDAGITLSKYDGAAVWAAGWAEIAEVATPERSRLPDGGNGVVVVVTTRQQRSHRFVVPAARPAALEEALDSLARRHAVAPPPPQRSQPALAVIGAIVVVGAIVLVLLLAAGHVIHL